VENSDDMPGVLRRTGSLSFGIGTSGQSLVFTHGVIEYLCRWRQRWRWQKEAGGQLFARFDERQVLVELATGPHDTDRRTRMSYIPDRDAERQESAQLFEQGLHFVGDWHSHPEKHPIPSAVDEKIIAECVRKSDHRLNGFLLVIVGTLAPPGGWHVSVHDGTDRYKLNLQCIGRHRQR
jgi:integrative and conjugative element protein (TIGR02256 family)